MPGKKNIITKFESKSARVKGLAFHHSRPWVLAALHNGVIQLWDYQLGCLVENFDEHDGPVRGVDFHSQQPLFCSGGDDYKIKLWDYNSKRCLFTLVGHIDYIRTVEFHRSYPWIVSASDDQSLRIWNWQSRSCISVLSGHNHYVMSASFHPKQDLVVSASLDQTVRVWDISELRKKHVKGHEFNPQPMLGNGGVNVQNDIFGSPEIIVKYVLEGHDRGVNWASFHPSLPLVVSGADDRQVKLWRMNETKAWLADTLRGHTNNVSCVLFHPKADTIVSNSEDRTIRVWDLTKRMGIKTVRRENDRFWILAAHPKQNLLAAGHDTGMLVFKLERERPAYDATRTRVFYVKDGYLRVKDFDGHENPICPVQTSHRKKVHSLFYNHYNQSQDSLLLTYSGNTEYELRNLQRGGAGGDGGVEANGQCAAVAFVSRGSFAVLDRSHTRIEIRDLRNNLKKTISASFGAVNLFPGGINKLLISTDAGNSVLYDVTSRKVVSELQCNPPRYVYWSEGGKHVALLSKNSITIASGNLAHECTVQESLRIKSGGWTDYGIFVYATLNHVKYLLPNGDRGTIKSLSEPVYIFRIIKDQMLVLTRQGTTKKIKLNLSEPLFKMALSRRRYRDVLAIIKTSHMDRKSIIAYIRKKGFPEIALHFVKNKRVCFDLALECGDLRAAVDCASEIKDNECWLKLGKAAVRQGNYSVVEIALQRVQDFSKLSFLYAISGETERMQKMLAISEIRKDVMSWYHNALYLGDKEAQVRALAHTGQLPLAYICAKVHGLEALVEELQTALSEEDLKRLECVLKAPSELTMPPLPITQNREQDNRNWPLSKKPHDSVLDAYLEEEEEQERQVAEQQKAARAAEAEAGGIVGGNEWGEDSEGEDHVAQNGDHEDGGKESGGWGGDDSDISDFEGDGDDAPSADVPDGAGRRGGGDMFIAPVAGKRRTAVWLEQSQVAGVHAASGDFEGAKELLRRQIAVRNFEPLREMFLSIFDASTLAIPATASTPFLGTSMRDIAVNGSVGRPMPLVHQETLSNQIRMATDLFKKGSFDKALQRFLAVIHAIPLVVVDTEEADIALRELLRTATNSTLFLLMMLQRKTVEQSDSKRYLELTCYCTHINLSDPKLMLQMLKVATKEAYKGGCYIVANSLARRGLEYCTKDDDKRRFSNTIKKCQQKGGDEVDLEYDPDVPFAIDGHDFVPIVPPAAAIKCPFCGTAYHAKHKGEVCNVCRMSEIGRRTIGLVSNAQGAGAAY